MSRSYKKRPICTDHRNGRKYWKRKANKRVRNAPEIFHGYKYKKLSNSYDIHDYHLRWTEEDAKKYYQDTVQDENYPTFKEQFLKRYPTEEDYLREAWAPYFKRK